MKVIFYLQPFVDVDIPDNLVSYHNLFIVKWISALKKYAHQAHLSLEIRVFVSELIHSKYLGNEEYASVSYLRLVNIFGSYHNYLQELKKADSAKVRQLGEDVVRNLNEFRPDLIVGCSTNISFLQDFYPNTRLLFNEAGIFNYNTGPYSTLYLDVIKDKKSSLFLLNIKKKQCNNVLVESFIKHFIDNLKLTHNYKRLRMHIDNTVFDRYILFALQRWNSEIMQLNTEFSTELEYIHAVCSKIDKKIGIIITMHRSSSVVANIGVQNYLQLKYPNLIFIHDTDNPSLYLMPLCSAVITTSSTVGFYAPIFKKKLLVPSQTSYLNIIADSNQIDDFNKVIEEKYVSKLSIIEFLINNYFIPSDNYKDGEMLYKRLKHFCSDSALFLEIDNLNEIMANYNSEQKKFDKGLLKKFFKIK